MENTIKTGDKFQVVNFLGKTLNYTVVSLKSVGAAEFALVLNDAGCEVLLPVAALGRKLEGVK